ncbi:MAG: prepilin-type N-terminal cleavage/methylation domain-containing protein [Planctomycetia bacterium]|nr:prepilin-type N-terminal cleavage/methylation domain-containing protein [Planctomycetia bacterium]
MRKGFTLIELLIVIGLLAALAAVLLPSLMGDRTTALEGVCNYNQAGTLRTLKQFESMTSGMLPNGLHTGYEVSTGNSPMSGLPTVLKANMQNSGATTLTAGDVAALASVGITKLAYGSGDPAGTTEDAKVGYEYVAVGKEIADVIAGTTAGTWVDDAGADYTFNGKTITLLEQEGYTKIIPLFIAPTTDWTAPQTTAWTKGFSVGMDVPGACPIPEGDFAYYVAYVGLKSDGYATYTASGVSGGGIASVPVPSSAEAEDDTQMQTFINDAVTAWNTANPDQVWTLTWGTASTDSDGVVTLSATAECVDAGGDPVGTGSYSITYDPNARKAKLLGTSCPECGITNP